MVARLWQKQIFDQGVSENMGTPNHPIFIGFSILFTINFGVSTIFGNTQHKSFRKHKRKTHQSHPIPDPIFKVFVDEIPLPGTNFSIGGRLSVRGAQRMDLFYCEVTRIESRIRCAAILLEGQFVSLLSSRFQTAFWFQLGKTSISIGVVFL